MFSFQENSDIEKLFPLIRKAGYDGVEPVLSENGYLNHKSTEKDILAIKKLADDVGLEIPSVGVWSLWDHNLVSNNSKVRQEAKDIILKQLECAALLGADTILIVPGYVGCDFAANPERVRYDHAYDRCAEALTELAPEAEKAGVSIGIENVWNRFLLSPLEVKHLLEEVNSPFVGVYFDVGNIMYIGYPEDWIEILAQYIKKIHLCDYRVASAGMSAFTDLFAGDVDFIRLARVLSAVGYDDYLTLEMLPNYRQFPEISMFSNRPAVEKITNLIKQFRTDGKTI